MAEPAGLLARLLSLARTSPGSAGLQAALGIKCHRPGEERQIRGHRDGVDWPGARVRLRRPPSEEGGRRVRSSFSFQSYGSITIVQVYVPGFRLFAVTP